VRKTAMHTSFPFAPPIPPASAHSRWDAFAAECVSWMMTRAESDVLTRSSSGEGRLLASFDVVGDWLNGRDHEGASVIDAVLKLNRRHPVGRVVARQAPRIRTAIVDLARQAGLVDVEEFADSWSILLKGAVLHAAEGDLGAPARARRMGGDLIARHRPAAVVESGGYDEESEFGWVDRPLEPRPSTSRSSAHRTEGGGVDWFDVYDWSDETAVQATPRTA